MSDETEFLPGFKTVADYVQSGFGLLTAATRWSNALPPEHTLYGYDNPASGYRSASAALRHNAAQVFKGILSKQANHWDKIGKGFEQLPDLNDTLVDSINKDLAELDGPVKEPGTQLIINKHNALVAQHQGSWNRSPVVCPLQMGKTKMLAAKNVERPQLSFKDKVDNSTKTLWIPKITEKPNNLKPLALSLIYDSDNEPVGYVHPYEVEIEAFTPQPQWVSKNGLGLLPIKEISETKMTLVETKEQLMDLVAHLRTVSEVGVDVEHHSYRTYQGITCLLQITTTDGGDFIIDTLSLREHLQILNECFTNPKILKILHGGSMDIIWLQRDLGIYIVGMFDTYQASIVLELPQRSLKALLHKYCDIHLDKTYQLADWRIRPLPAELCEYARSDTHYLISLWRMLRQELFNNSNGKTNFVEAVFTQSKAICLQNYVKPICNENDYMNLYLKSKKVFNPRQLKALKTIYQWRDDIARIEDESSNYVLPNHMLLQIAEALPREVQGLLACCNPVPPLLKRNLVPVHQIILRARETKMESNNMNNVTTVTQPVVTSLPSILMCVHDKPDDDDREHLPSLPKTGGGPIRRQKRTKHNRKPWSLETPPPIIKDVDLLSVTKRFIPPYQRLLLVNEYKEYIQSHEEHVINNKETST